MILTAIPFRQLKAYCKMQVAIIKYNSGNVFSVQNALNRIGVDSIITDNKRQIENADRIIFPGVGHAASAMQYLQERDLDTIIKNLLQPVLGICLGMQLMCAHSEEGDTSGLGIFDANVKKFASPLLKVPQVGWNDIENCRSVLFEGLKEHEYMYYVHGYYAVISQHTCAQTTYILPYSAALHSGNFYAVQFHPEKSGRAGEKLLKNFIERT